MDKFYFIEKATHNKPWGNHYDQSCAMQFNRRSTMQNLLPPLVLCKPSLQDTFHYNQFAIHLGNGVIPTDLLQFTFPCNKNANPAGRHGTIALPLPRCNGGLFHAFWRDLSVYLIADNTQSLVLFTNTFMMSWPGFCNFLATLKLWSAWSIE